MRRDDLAGHPLYDGIARIYSHHGQLWPGTPEHFFKRLYADFDYRVDDIWIVTYPRSGTAWTYQTAWGVLYGGDTAALERAKHEARVPRFLPIEIGTARSVADRIDSWYALPSPRVIPTHLPRRLFPSAALGQSCKRIYVLRDGRDVAVSFYHFHRAHKALGYYRGSWAEFFELFMAGDIIYNSWFDHVLDWLSDRQEGALLLRYEDLQQNIQSQIRRIAAFLDKDLSPQRIAAVAEQASFTRMQSDRLNNYARYDFMDAAVAPFLRKGVSGDWKNYFSDEQDARFRARWAERVRERGLRGIVNPFQS